MMIVVPALAHGEERSETNVAALYRRAAYFADQFAVIVGKVADQPVAENAGGDAGADAPKYKSPAAADIEEDRPGQVLRHPSPFQEPVEIVLQDSGFDADARSSVQNQVAIQLPPGVTPGR